MVRVQDLIPDSEARFAAAAPYVESVISTTGLSYSEDEESSEDALLAENIAAVIEWRALGLQPDAIARLVKISEGEVEEIAEAFFSEWNHAAEDAFNHLLHIMHDLARGKQTPKSGQLSYLQAMLGYLSAKSTSDGEEDNESIVNPLARVVNDDDV